MKNFRRVHVCLCAAAVLILSIPPAGAARLPRLRVSDNKRFLVTQDGKPFFYLADTAWELPDLTREDVDHYLQDRAAKRFTVIQATIASGRGMRMGNSYGDKVFVDEDPGRPNEAFFKHVDYVIRKAESLGLYMAVLPVWAQKHISREKSILDKEAAFRYGKFLGNRYRDASLIWVLGGDWVPDGVEDVWRALAAGLREGDGGSHLMTFHPTSIHSSSQWFHDEPWLDLNMFQSRHLIYNRGYELAAADYARSPVKPVIDGESGYEGIFDNMGVAKPPARIQAHDCRRYAYTSIFAGAAGYAYGATEVFGFWTPARGNLGFAGSAQYHWTEALQRPGAGQMRHLRALMESRPMLKLVPDQWMIVNDPRGTTDRIQACRASDGSYAYLYTALGRTIDARMKEKYYDFITGNTVRAWWYDPRTGAATLIGEFEKKGHDRADQARTEATREFTPPSSGDGNDWVLVLDDASLNLPAPGQRAR